MAEMLSMAINLHLFMIGSTILLAMYMIYASKRIDDNILYINRIKYLQPQYLILVASIIFTGVTVMAVEHFDFRPTLVLMIIAVLIIYYSSIKKHMLRKQTDTNNLEDMKFLRNHVSKKYIIDIFLMLMVGIISKFIGY